MTSKGLHWEARHHNLQTEDRKESVYEHIAIEMLSSSSSPKKCSRHQSHQNHNIQTGDFQKSVYERSRVLSPPRKNCNIKVTNNILQHNLNRGLTIVKKISMKKTECVIIIQTKMAKMMILMMMIIVRIFISHQPCVLKHTWQDWFNNAQVISTQSKVERFWQLNSQRPGNSFKIKANTVGFLLFSI